jgi:hypothetical protein
MIGVIIEGRDPDSGTRSNVDFWRQDSELVPAFDRTVIPLGIHNRLEAKPLGLGV